MSIYIGLLLTVMILIVNGSIPRSTIEKDVQTLTKLREKFINLIPSTAARRYEQRCRVVKECCPKEQENIYTMFTDGLTEDQCLTSERKQLPSCKSTLSALEKMIHDPVCIKFIAAVYPNDGGEAHVDGRKKLDDETRKVCSKSEMNALFCDRNNMKKLKSCQSKILKSIAQDDDKVYNNYVSQWKNDFIFDNKNLHSAFRKDS